MGPLLRRGWTGQQPSDMRYGPKAVNEAVLGQLLDCTAAPGPEAGPMSLCCCRCTSPPHLLPGLVASCLDAASVTSH